MNATMDRLLPAIGSPLDGGFYAGALLIEGIRYALIVSPAAEGEHDDIAWNGDRQKVAGALSFNDGLANTAAMAEAGSALAIWARGLVIAGHSDWYIPARDELELLYRNLKPTTDRNWCWRGDNPSSIPVGYAYAPDAPGQTSVEAFRKGGDQALGAEAYWSSTHFAGNESHAWAQNFDDGGQAGWRKGLELRARAVRRLIIR